MTFIVTFPLEKILTEIKKVTRRTSKPSGYYSGSIDPETTATIFSVSGKRGRMKGYILRTRHVSPGFVKITMTIDGVDIFELFMAGVISIFNTDPADVRVPTYAKPIAITMIDTTDHEYGFSWTTEEHFENEFKITIRNYDSSTTLEYDLLISIDEEV